MNKFVTASRISFFLFTTTLLLFVTIESFTSPAIPHNNIVAVQSHHCCPKTPRTRPLLYITSNNEQPPTQTTTSSLVAIVVGLNPTDDHETIKFALQQEGYTNIILTQESSHDDAIHDGDGNNKLSQIIIATYKFSRATGMLQLTSSSSSSQSATVPDLPRWIPLVRNMENVLVANGWSFLDPDENDPVSAFDVDAANIEGQYRPKWGTNNEHTNDNTNKFTDNNLHLSNLGYDISPMTSNEVLNIVATNISNDLSKRVLLDGATDPPKVKKTHNGFNFSGPTGQSEIEHGVFVCAVGGLPLFCSYDLSPTTASSGWLSFSKPICSTHVKLIQPALALNTNNNDENANNNINQGITSMMEVLDQRTEVICAKSGCHLGHYFGRDGYCINASALNFIKKDPPQSININDNNNNNLETPISWRSLEQTTITTPSQQLLYFMACKSQMLQLETIVFGAGCFWHVETALRRLPGIVSTTAGYAGGIKTHPTYEQVCQGDTHHAEVVKVIVDTNKLSIQTLVDCFLTMHDPTKVRAHGKHAETTGQYRSCIFFENMELQEPIMEALQDCAAQLQKNLSTQVVPISCNNPIIDSNNYYYRFWPAEDRHQRHEETKNPQKDYSTLSTISWLQEYGRRKASVMGSFETINKI